MNSQRYGRVMKSKAWKDLGCKDFGLHGAGVGHPSGMWTCLLPRSSLNSIVQGFLWRVHHAGMID